MRGLVTPLEFVFLTCGLSGRISEKPGSGVTPIYHAEASAQAEALAAAACSQASECQQAQRCCGGLPSSRQPCGLLATPRQDAH
jgi:hypothetical protein